jgi:hypothetical protein
MVKENWDDGEKLTYFDAGCRPVARKQENRIIPEIDR